MIDGRNVFNQPVRNNIKTYESIITVAAVHGDDYATCCLLSYLYFEKKYKMIAIDLK